MSCLQLLFLGLAAATWLIGGNIVVALHYRRMGKSLWSGFWPFASPNFNAREALAILVLLIVALTFGVVAISLNSE